MTRQPLRLGVVSYLNVAPLVHGLDRDPRFQLEPDVPARVAERLHEDDIDLGMIPVVEYSRADYRIVPGLAIASDGPVRSVNLYHHGPSPNWTGLRRIAVDESSRTSVALLKLLLDERLDYEPEWLVRGPDIDAMLAEADAALVIGDAALYDDSARPRWDLGEAWTVATGLPFVWAFWAGRPGRVDASDVERLAGALDRGLAAIPQIASSYNGHVVASARTNETYLRENIRFRLGERELLGLREFYRRAAAAGLIDAVPELSFYDDP